MIPRTLFSEDHEIFRRAVKAFIVREIAPHHAAWEKAGIVSRECWEKAGAQGLLCCAIPEVYGGGGGDFLYGAIVQEELAFAGTTGPGFHLHSDIAAPYLLHYGTEAQKQIYLPRMARGECIAALAITEPSAGSDVAALRTSATRDGDGWRLNGQKTFITNGQNADLVIVACKTDPDAGAKGLSLMLVERGDKGFERGRNLEKIGWHAQDTSELFFDNVWLPSERLLGPMHGGFACLMQQLPQERLLACIRTVAAIEAVIDGTIQYTRDRIVFGKALSEKQNTRFKIADAKAEAVAARILTDKLIELHLKGALDATLAAVGKLHVTELSTRLMDACLQLHGGYGYMAEYAVARAWVDNRFSRIAGGSSEVMRELIARALFGR